MDWCASDTGFLDWTGAGKYCEGEDSEDGLLHCLVSKEQGQRGMVGSCKASGSWKGLPETLLIAIKQQGRVGLFYLGLDIAKSAEI